MNENPNPTRSAKGRPLLITLVVFVLLGDAIETRHFFDLIDAIARQYVIGDSCPLSTDAGFDSAEFVVSHRVLVGFGVLLPFEFTVSVVAVFGFTRVGVGDGFLSAPSIVLHGGNDRTIQFDFGLVAHAIVFEIECPTVVGRADDFARSVGRF